MNKFLRKFDYDSPGQANRAGQLRAASLCTTDSLWWASSADCPPNGHWWGASWTPVASLGGQNEAERAKSTGQWVAQTGWLAGRSAGLESVVKSGKLRVGKGAVRVSISRHLSPLWPATGHWRLGRPARVEQRGGATSAGRNSISPADSLGLARLLTGHLVASLPHVHAPTGGWPARICVTCRQPTEIGPKQPARQHLSQQQQWAANF